MPLVAEAVEGGANGLALRIENGRLECDVDASFHLAILQGRVVRAEVVRMRQCARHRFFRPNHLAHRESLRLIMKVAVVPKKFAQHGIRFGGQLRLSSAAVHQLHPAVPRAPDQSRTAHAACAAADARAARYSAADRQSGKSGNPAAALPRPADPAAGYIGPRMSSPGTRR